MSSTENGHTTCSPTPVPALAPGDLIDQIRVLLANTGPAAVPAAVRGLLAAAADALDTKAAAAEQVHFYRRGDEKVWHKTSAEHIETIKRLTEERYECHTFYTAPPAATLSDDAVEAMGEGMGEGDAIARSKFILCLVDAYVEKPSADTRRALRTALMHQFDRNITPQALLDIARTTGLRAHMHGVPPTLARELLAEFVAAVPAAACGDRDLDLDQRPERINPPTRLLVGRGQELQPTACCNGTPSQPARGSHDRYEA